MKKNKKLLIVIIIIIVVLILIGIGTLYYINKSSIEMSLNGDQELTLNYNEEYTENGAKATYLNKDIEIEISGEVDTSKVGTYEITYKAKHGKKEKELTRKINIVDTVSPTLELNGQPEIKLYTGNKYNEPGFIATDEYDGDITDKVLVNNPIDINTVGSYTVTYEVSDSSNNKITKERKVEILERPKTVNSGGIPVLMYHFFYDKNVETKNDGNWMEIHLFEEQMKYLYDNGYYTPTWQEFIDYVDGKITLPEKSVIVTADDGNPSFFTLAIPICQKYNIRPTSFIVSSWTHGDWLASAWKDKGVDFQSHTYDMHKGGCKENHGGLMNCISHDAGVNDLKTGIADLEQVNKVYAIAYPFGDVNANVKQITKDAGIQVGFTTAYGKVRPGMDKLELPRIRVSDGTSLEAFINKLK